MGSVSNTNPWVAPNAVLKDCSQGICSMYCPQWCYIMYSPPPPSIVLGDDSDDDDASSGFQFSPLIVAVIGILASTFILVTYYTVISRFCRNRGRINDPNYQENRSSNDDSLNNNESSLASATYGMDEAQIKSITVCKYVKNGGLVEGSDCSVCLCEFQEDESLRLLPKCNHAFHLPCIDTWLKSQASCPLCRSNIVFNNNSNNPNLSESDSAEIPHPPPARVSVNSLEYQQRSDDIVTIIIHSSQQSSQRQQQQEVVVDFGNEVQVKWPNVASANNNNNGENLNRHSTSQRRLSVADILNQDHEADDV
ncbi:hypothetical protein PIB30_065395 [Stylosanthes scabra]|uniref:RING-type E3 ubiquitin transferase n=1 Tax=Stylosanthes scabra TaxID=79078 RepID=A0ABU6TMZ0_9FABA|nr:hypothetical protein [Stylosanthes scabra]